MTVYVYSSDLKLDWKEYSNNLIMSNVQMSPYIP